MRATPRSWPHWLRAYLILVALGMVLLAALAPHSAQAAAPQPAGPLIQCQHTITVYRAWTGWQGVPNKPYSIGTELHAYVDSVSGVYCGTAQVVGGFSNGAYYQCVTLDEYMTNQVNPDQKTICLNPGQVAYYYAPWYNDSTYPLYGTTVDDVTGYGVQATWYWS